jgi:hypothetical protein
MSLTVKLRGMVHHEKCFDRPLVGVLDKRCFGSNARIFFPRVRNMVDDRIG